MAKQVLNTTGSHNIGDDMGKANENFDELYATLNNASVVSTLNIKAASNFETTITANKQFTLTFPDYCVGRVAEVYAPANAGVGSFDDPIITCSGYTMTPRLVVSLNNYDNTKAVVLSFKFIKVVGTVITYDLYVTQP